MDIVHQPNIRKAIETFREVQNRSRHQDLVFNQLKVKSEDVVVYPRVVKTDFFEGEAALNHKKCFEDMKIRLVSKKEKIKCKNEVGFHEIFDQSTKNSKYLALIGHPGSGKTTLAKLLAKSDEIRCFYINALNPNLKKLKLLTLEQLLLLDVSNFKNKSVRSSNILKWIIDNQMKTAIIIDDFDQSKWNLHPKSPFFDYETPQNIENLISNLCRRHYLPDVHLIIVSRPHSIMTIPEMLRPKITLFVRDLKFDDMKKLFFAFVHAQDRAKKIWDKWEKINEEFPQFLDFCLNPMMLQRCIQFFLDLSTSMNNEVILTQIFAILVEKNDQIHRIKKQLGAIAFDATVASTVVITIEQLKQEKLTMEDVQDLIVAVQGYSGYTSTIFDEDINLYFSHQLLQKYFTAYHIVENLPLSELSNVLKTRFFTPEWLMVRKFVSGLVLDAGIQTKGDTPDELFQSMESLSIAEAASDDETALSDDEAISD